MLLNDPPQKGYRQYVGKPSVSLQQMPLENAHPISVYEALERRVNAHSSCRDEWRQTTIGTSDRFRKNGDGSAVIISYEPITRTRPRPKERVLQLSKERLESLVGLNYTSESIANSPVWMFLAGEDKELLKEYAILDLSESEMGLSINISSDEGFIYLNPLGKRTALGVVEPDIESVTMIDAIYPNPLIVSDVVRRVRRALPTQHYAAFDRAVQRAFSKP